MSVDPTKVRLSETLLLSDLLVCDSVVRRGYANKAFQEGSTKHEEAVVLAMAVDDLQDEFGPCMVSYGYISPELSQKIITYQDPNKPSYHRFDIGAAVDLCFPNQLEAGNNQQSPIELCRQIHERDLMFSRMITYAESPWICFATSIDTPTRKAFYENRYTGERKPEYINYGANNERRMERLRGAATQLEHDWEGKGYPSYHGGGRQQFQHIDTSEHTTMLSWLYDKHKVHKGEKNLPPLTNKPKMKNWYECAYMAGDVIDAITDMYGRVSIIRAYNSDVPSQQWDKRFTMEIVPREGRHPDDVADLASMRAEVAKVTTSKRSVMIVGEYL